jgi:hypothetical protein
MYSVEAWVVSSCVDDLGYRLLSSEELTDSIYAFIDMGNQVTLEVYLSLVINIIGQEKNSNLLRILAMFAKMLPLGT